MRQLSNKINVLIIGLSLNFLTACSSSSAQNWLLTQLSNPSVAVPVETTFSVNITPSTGDASFLLNTLRNQASMDLYSVALDFTNATSGSLMQIREFSGSRTGRVVFQIVESGQGNLQGKYSIDPETHLVTFSFTYQNETFAGQTQLTRSTLINKTVYLYHTLKGIPVITNTPPVAVIAPVQFAAQAGSTLSVSLDGSGSSDSDGDLLSYSWTLESPAGSLAALSDATSINPSFEADQPGVYRASLKVNDGKVDSDIVVIEINVKAANAVAAQGVEDAIASLLQLPLFNSDGSANFYNQNGQKQIIQQLKLVLKMIELKNYNVALEKLEQQKKHARGEALTIIEQACVLLTQKLPETNGADGVDNWLTF